MITIVYTIAVFDLFLYMSTTRTVSIRAFRENLTKFLKEAQEKNVHFVVMRHAEPIAHVTPLHGKEASYEQLVAEIAQARKDAAEGRVYTTEQVLAMIDRRARRIHAAGNRTSGAPPAKHRRKNRAKNGVVRKTGTPSVIRKKAH